MNNLMKLFGIDSRIYSSGSGGSGGGEGGGGGSEDPSAPAVFYVESQGSPLKFSYQGDMTVEYGDGTSETLSSPDTVTSVSHAFA